MSHGCVRSASGWDEIEREPTGASSNVSFNEFPALVSLLTLCALAAYVPTASCFQDVSSVRLSPPVRSMAMRHRPEYQLSSQSPVLTARFHPFDTHVIIGGTYSGQARATSRLTRGVRSSIYSSVPPLIVRICHGLHYRR